MTQTTTQQTLAPTDIRTDGGTQPRARLDQDKIQEYTDAMKRGDKFPPLKIFFDGDQYWLADGFHRLQAHNRAHGRLQNIAADIEQGTQRDAILHSAGANATHGLPRSAEDKRRAVKRLLNDDEWSAWSDREIARRTKTSHPFVGKLRADVEASNGNLTGNVSSERTYVNKHGTQSTMKTANIGYQRPKPFKERLERDEQFKNEPPIDVDDLKDYVEQYIEGQAIAFEHVNAPHHVNSIFWRHLTRHLDEDGILWNEATLKFVIKKLHKAVEFTASIEQYDAEKEALELPPDTLKITVGEKSLADARADLLQECLRKWRAWLAGQPNDPLTYLNDPYKYISDFDPLTRYDAGIITQAQQILKNECSDKMDGEPEYASIHQLEQLLRQYLLYRTGGHQRHEHLDILDAIKNDDNRKSGEEFTLLFLWMVWRNRFRKNDLWQAAMNKYDQLRQAVAVPPDPSAPEPVEGVEGVEAKDLRAIHLKEIEGRLTSLIIKADAETERPLLVALTQAILQINNAIDFLKGE